MILKVILSLTFVFWSVKILTGLMTTVIKKEAIYLQQFEIKTKQDGEDFIRHQKGFKGFGTLLSLSFLALMALFFTWAMLCLCTYHQELTYRRNTYLCFYKEHQLLVRYFAAINAFNVGLKIAYKAKLLMPSNETLTAFKAIVIARNTFHINYLYSLQRAPFCQANDVFDYLNNIPFELTPTHQLKTDFDESAIPKRKIWKNQIGHYQPNIRKKKLFYLEASYAIQSWPPKICINSLIEKVIAGAWN